MNTKEISTHKSYRCDGIKNRIKISMSSPRKGTGDFSFLISRESAEKIVEILQQEKEKIPVCNWMGKLVTCTAFNLDEYNDIR